MQRKTPFYLLVLALFGLLPLLFVYQTRAAFQRIHERHTAPFRYVIYSNKIVPVGRNVDVLLDKEAFSEDTLKQLFYLVSKRFPEPGYLHVSVQTSLWQTETPEEQDVGQISEQGEDPHYRQFPRAVLMRINGDELFRYSSDEEPPYRNLKTVILKGRDPFNPSKN
jgi:hypothetical protein